MRQIRERERFPVTGSANKEVDAGEGGTLGVPLACQLRKHCTLNTSTAQHRELPALRCTCVFSPFDCTIDLFLQKCTLSC